MVDVTTSYSTEIPIVSEIYSVLLHFNLLQIIKVVK